MHWKLECAFSLNVGRRAVVSYIAKRKSIVAETSSPSIREVSGEVCTPLDALGMLK